MGLGEDLQQGTTRPERALIRFLMRMEDLNHGQRTMDNHRSAAPWRDMDSVGG
jgi:hypothetical protein